MAIGGMPAIYQPNGEIDELDLMTIEEVAAILKVDKSTVCRMIQRGEMKASHFGRSVRVKRADLIVFVKTHSD